MPAALGYGMTGRLPGGTVKMSELKSFAAAAALGVGIATGLAGAAVGLGAALALLPMRLLPVGCYLVYAGFLILRERFGWSLATGRIYLDLIAENLFGSLALMASGIISAVLAFKAYSHAPSGGPWLYALALPAVVALAYSFGYRKADDAPTPEDEVEVEAGTGKLYRRAYVASSFISALWTGLVYIFFFAAIGVFICQWMLLDRCLFGNEWEGFATAIVAQVRFFGPLALLVGVVFAVATFVVGLVAMVFHWLSLGTHPDANRDLSNRELAFIEAAQREVRAYGEANGYGQRDWRAVVVMTALYLVFGMAAFAALYKTFLPGGSPPAEAAHILLYLQPDTGPSAALMVFTICLMIPLPSILLSIVWRRYSEYAMWRGLVKKTAEYVTLTGRLTNFVRTGRLDCHRKFDPGDFLHRAGMSLARLMLLPLVPVMALTAWFYWLDSRNADVLADSSITVVHYWSGSPRTFPYSAVRGISLQCTYGRNDRLEYAYTILLPDGFAVDASRTLHRRNTVAALTAIDDKLAGVPVSFELRRPLWREPYIAYDPACVRELAGEFSAADGERILRLFHLRQWQAGHGHR